MATVRLCVSKPITPRRAFDLWLQASSSTSNLQGLSTIHCCPRRLQGLSNPLLSPGNVKRCSRLSPKLSKQTHVSICSNKYNVLRQMGKQHFFTFVFCHFLVHVLVFLDTYFSYVSYFYLWHLFFLSFIIFTLLFNFIGLVLHARRMANLMYLSLYIYIYI